MKVVDGRQLYRCLGVSSNFRHWIKRRIKECGLEDGVQFRSDLTGIGHKPTTRQGRAEKRGAAGAYGKGYTLSAKAARHIAASETNAVGHAIREYLFEIEDQFWQANADAARRIHDDLAVKVTDLQSRTRNADDLIARQAAATSDLNTRLWYLELENVYLKGELLVRDADDEIAETEETLHDLKGRRRTATGVREAAAEGMRAEAWAPTGFRPKAAEGRTTEDEAEREAKREAKAKRERAAWERHLAVALDILRRLGIPVTKGGTLGGGTVHTGANDSLVRLVRRWKAEGAETVLRTLKDHVERTRNPIAMGTLILRAIANFDASWAGHAESSWFAAALGGIDFRAMRGVVLEERQAVRDEPALERVEVLRVQHHGLIGLDDELRGVPGRLEAVELRLGRLDLLPPTLPLRMGLTDNPMRIVHTSNLHADAPVGRISTGAVPGKVGRPEGNGEWRFPMEGGIPVKAPDSPFPTERRRS